MTESRDRAVQQLMACIALPSPTPPGEVGAVADWIEAWAESFGARVERQEVEPGKDNVLATLDFGPGPTLVFNSHMDVNNPTGQSWRHPPFEPFLTEGRLYGLGACDAKGSLVAMLCAMERLAVRRERLGGKLVLTAVMGEEAGGLGSLHLVRQGIQADGAVVGEPTGLQVAVAHKGTYMRKIVFRGRAAHSGSAHLGINAIQHAAMFCVEYEALNRRLAKAPHPVLGPATAAVTVMSGGTRQNTIPSRAELIVDRRLIPGETHAKADEELDAILSELKQRVQELDVESVEVIVATIPSQTQDGAAILPAALAAAGEVLGEERLPAGFSAGCDMSKLAAIAGIPTVIFGPGSLTEAHAPDEFVDLDQLDQAVHVYERARAQVSEREGGNDVSRLELFLRQERENQAFSGAAYVYGGADGISRQGVVGTLSWDDPEVTLDSLWDLASVTKPIVALALMKLFDCGECYLDQPISDFLPDYRDTDKRDVTLRELLTHTSGIPGQQPLYLHADTKERMLASIRGLPLRHAPGTFVEYSSQGFIIVGLAIEAIAGRPLDAAMRELVFEPLGLRSMTFNPQPEWREQIAATEACPWRGVTVQGQVHDENAVILGGVGGHAGLFAKPEDLAKIARMMLRRGDTPDGRYLSAAAVDRMTRNDTADLNLARALGWQAKDKFRSPAGDLFSSRSYGHTGFTGTSLWMDPEADLFAALLTNRVHPDRRNDRIKRVRAIAHNLIYMEYTQGESVDEN